MGRAAAPGTLFYGWVILPVAMVVMMATSPGQTYGVSTFIPYLIEDLGLSQSQISGAYMLGTLLASAPMIYVGILMDRHGPRATLIVVVVFFGLACIGMSQARGLVTVFLGFLFLRMLGQGAMSFLAANSLAMWFNRRLGFASGLKSLGGAIALGVFPAASLAMVQEFGWRTTYAVLGVLVWIVVLPLLVFVFRNRPEDLGQQVDGQPPPDPAGESSSDPARYRDYGLKEAVRTHQYWIMVVATILPAMIITAIHFHAVQLFLNAGLTERDAAAMFSIFAVAFSVTMVIGGILADRFPLNFLLSASTACLAGGIALLMVLSGPVSARIFAIVLGSSQGLFMAVGATIWVRYYGRSSLGKIRGGLTTVGVAASSAGPFLMGGAYDLYGGYQEILQLFLLLTLPMVVAALFVTRPPRIECDPGPADPVAGS